MAGLVRTLLLFALLLVPLRAFAFCDGWSAADTVAASTYSALALQDWAQTRWFAGREGHTESNPLLGKRPSPEKINLFVGAAVAGVWAVGCLLPKDEDAEWGSLRFQWFAFFATVEAWAVWSNSEHTDKGLFVLQLAPLHF